MTSELRLDIATDRIVVSDEWDTVLWGTSTIGNGAQVVATVRAAPTPGASCEIRLRTEDGGHVSASKPVTQETVATLGPITVSNTVRDIVEVQARRVSGEGGIIILSSGALQGTLADVDAPSTIPPTVIITQPVSTAVQVGQTAVFSVAASGQNLTYLWERSTDGGNNWDPTAGTLSTYTISSAQAAANGYQYRCEVTGDNGVVTSSAVTLTVGTVGAIVTLQPVPATVLEGSFAVFTASAIAADFWYGYVRTGGTGNGTRIGSVVGSFSDDFNRADETPLAGTWTGDGTVNLANNRAESSGLYNYASIGIADTDSQWAETTFAGSAAATGWREVGVAVRMPNDTVEGGYMAHAGPTAQGGDPQRVTLNRINTNGRTILATHNHGSTLIGKKIGVAVSGTMVKAYVDGVEVLSITDSSVPASANNRRIGMWFYSNTTTVWADDFQGGDGTFGETTQANPQTGPAQLSVGPVNPSDDGKEYRFGFTGSDAVEVFTDWALLSVLTADAPGLLVTDTEIT